MRNWLHNKARKIQIKEKVENEFQTEKSLLKDLEMDLSKELSDSIIPYALIESFILNEKGSLLVFTAAEGTYSSLISDVSEIEEHIAKLFPYDIEEHYLVDNKFKFKLKIAYKGFSRFLPTIPIMHIENDSHVWFTLNLNTTVNVKEIRYFADIVVGKEQIAQDDITYQSVFVGALRYYSEKYGITLIAPGIEKINLQTSLFTQLSIQPESKIPTISPLRVTLGQFYHEDLEEKIKEYVKEIVEYLSWEKEFQRLETVLKNIVYKRKYDSFFTVNIDTKKSKRFNFYLTSHYRKFPEIRCSIDYYFVKYKDPTEYIDVLLKEEVIKALKKYFDRTLSYEVRELINKKRITVGDTFLYNIQGESYFRIADLELLDKCLEMELFLLETYGEKYAKNVHFRYGEGHSVEQGWIGVNTKNWDEVKCSFYYPKQHFFEIKYSTIWLDHWDWGDKNIDWCKYSLKVDSELKQISCTLEGEKVIANFEKNKRKF